MSLYRFTFKFTNGEIEQLYNQCSYEQVIAIQEAYKSAPTGWVHINNVVMRIEHIMSITVDEIPTQEPTEA